MRRPITVATCGTSLTYGVDNGDPWQGWVERMLTGLTSREVRVLNFGVAAQDSVMRLAELEAGLYLPTQPDVVVVEFAMNDAYTPRSITTAQCKANALEIIERFQAVNPLCRAFVMTMNPCVAGSAQAALRPSLSLYTNKYREIAAENPLIGLIDNEPDWGAADYGRIPDGVHPTRNAERPIIVPNMVEALLPIVNAMAG
ncbi:SGNH/GDSL hydrolase family protein [Rhizobium sp. 768_B6_N1_8]|uniref:SGNH/GDSL hydrolase family protein n=1 Tax=unclassified Rhizobium TaxID=2613769 RepID=UPI003F229B50